jgi:histidinol-phosphate aminotransferase
MLSKKPLVPDHFKNLKPYVPGKTISEVKKSFNPVRISKLASNENRMGYSPGVEEAVKNSLNVIQDYPDPVSMKLREKIAGKNGIEPENVLIAAGLESIISIICRTFFVDGENAVTGATTFVGFFVQAAVRGVELKKIPMTPDFNFDVEGILNAVDEHTKMVYIANPNNPTGTYIKRGDYEKLVDQLPGDVLLVNDEAYYEYACIEDDYPSAMDYFKNNLIVLRTFSKAYGLAGLRIGYAMADSSLIKEMMKTKLTFEPSVTAQYAALVSYGDTEFIEKSIGVVQSGREKLYRLFDEYGIRYAVSASNSVMIMLDDEQQAEEFNRYMLINGVILRRIDSFGMPNAIRITIGTKDDMDHFESVFRVMMSEHSFRKTIVNNDS